MVLKHYDGNTSGNVLETAKYSLSSLLVVSTNSKKHVRTKQLAKIQKSTCLVLDRSISDRTGRNEPADFLRPTFFLQFAIEQSG